MNRAILGKGGAVMQYVGDAVMAVLGAPVARTGHADRALAAALAMHAAQSEVNRAWDGENLPRFGLGIGVSTGEVVAAMLGSEERVEYTVVGDTVNMAQRLENLARPAGCTVISEATWRRLTNLPRCRQAAAAARQGQGHAGDLLPASAGLGSQDREPETG